MKLCPLHYWKCSLNQLTTREAPFRTVFESDDPKENSCHGSRMKVSSKLSREKREAVFKGLLETKSFQLCFFSKVVLFCFFLKYFTYLGCCWVFPAVHRLLLWRLPLLQSTGSRAWGLQELCTSLVAPWHVGSSPIRD